MAAWLEVSLTVTPELAEAVADVLARYAPHGVVTEQGVAYRDAADAGVASGDITVRGYLEQNAALGRTREQLEASLHYLGMIQPLPAPAYREIGDRNWMEAWKHNYRPIPVGRRIQIVPAWLENPAPDRTPIRIDPGMAFGTGTHPSTQLCLLLLERALAQEPPQTSAEDSAHPGAAARTVIDVGCGSGILSIAALKLGAACALGVDIDAASLTNARENAELNGIAVGLQLGVGSVAEIRSGAFVLRSAQLVLANILAPVIIRLFDDGLGDIVERGGELILGGVLHDQRVSVLRSARAAGFRCTDRVRSDDWIALALKR